MREIKFRAWLKKDGILVYEPIMVYQIERCFHDAGYTIGGDRCEVCDFHGFSEVLQGVEDGDVILMQYTGKKDKNGVEVYEEDVVKCHDHGERIGVVKHGYSSGCVFEGYFIESDYLFNPCDFDRLEVIGNIYENPELVKE